MTLKQRLHQGNMLPLPSTRCLLPSTKLLPIIARLLLDNKGIQVDRDINE